MGSSHLFLCPNCLAPLPITCTNDEVLCTCSEPQFPHLTNSHGPTPHFLLCPGWFKPEMQPALPQPGLEERCLGVCRIGPHTEG